MAWNRQGGFHRNESRLARNRADSAYGYGLPTGAGDMGYEFGDEFGAGPDFGAGPEAHRKRQHGAGRGSEAPTSQAGQSAATRVPGAWQEESEPL